MAEDNTSRQNFDLDDELKPEYNLSQLLAGVVRGKYADRYQEGANLVLLDADVATAFPTPEVVNEALWPLGQIPARRAEA